MPRLLALLSPHSRRLLFNAPSLHCFSDRNWKRISEIAREGREMPTRVFYGSVSSPKIDLSVDMGNPFLNRAVDGFLKIGAVAASRVLVDESYQCVRKGSISKEKIEHALKRMGREGAYWGTVAGAYVGMEYSMERIRGTRDWKNATLGGALTGALVSAASNNGRDKVIKDAITAGAIATAAEFIAYLT